MPYQWLPPSADETAHLRLWPHNSLPANGFVWFIAATATLIALPLFAELGTVALWIMLPFLAAAVAAIWIALRKNRRDRAITEDLILTADRITLTRRGPGDRIQSWQANPHWARLTLYPTAGPVPQYLTLTGNGREVELGAFLTETERKALHADLATRLRPT